LRIVCGLVKNSGGLASAVARPRKGKHFGERITVGEESRDGLTCITHLYVLWGYYYAL
jgi:hypothetical protein